MTLIQWTIRSQKPEKEELENFLLSGSTDKFNFFIVSVEKNITSY